MRFIYLSSNEHDILTDMRWQICCHVFCTHILWIYMYWQVCCTCSLISWQVNLCPPPYVPPSEISINNTNVISIHEAFSLNTGGLFVHPYFCDVEGGMNSRWEYPGFQLSMHRHDCTPWILLNIGLVLDLPPRIPVANEGLGWDPRA